MWSILKRGRQLVVRQASGLTGLNSEQLSGSWWQSAPWLTGNSKPPPPSSPPHSSLVVSPFSRRKYDATVNTVVKLSSSDDHPVLCQTVVNFMLKFDAVLSPEKLRSSLEKLVSRNDGWRKHAARLKIDGKGKLEYHIPSHFSAERPCLSFTHVNHDMSLKEHPIARQLPTATRFPAVVANPNKLHPLLRPHDGPRELGDYLENDVPQLGLHVVNFHDATLVSLTWPHTLLDGTGQKGLLRAWSLALRDRDDEIQPLYGIGNNPHTRFGVNHHDPYKIDNQLITKEHLRSHGVRPILDTLRKGEEARTICLPAAYVGFLRDRASRDLAFLKNTEEAVPFVTEGDVLCAWMARLAVANYVRGSGANPIFSIVNAEVKPLLADDHLPLGNPQVSNAVHPVYAFLTRDDIVARPIGYIAAAIRRSIIKLDTRKRTEAYGALSSRHMAETTMPPVFGGSSTESTVLSNWTKTNFFDVDFSAALMATPSQQQTQGRNARRDMRVMPTYVQTLGFNKGISSCNSASIMGKDAEGSYWLSAILPRVVWDRIAKASTWGLMSPYKH